MADGGAVYYVATDGTQTEWGIGTLKTNDIPTLERTSLIGNSYNSKNVLNFTGKTKVFSFLPGNKIICYDSGGNVRFTGNALVTATFADGSDTLTQPIGSQIGSSQFYIQLVVNDSGESTGQLVIRDNLGNYVKILSGNQNGIIRDAKNRIIATIDDVNGVSSALNDLKSKAITSEAYSDFDTEIAHMRIMHNQPHQRVQVDGKNERWSLPLIGLDELNDEINRAINEENRRVLGDGLAASDQGIERLYFGGDDASHVLVRNRNGTIVEVARISDVDNSNASLNDLKSKAITSEAYSDYDTAIAHMRILHDQPHQRVQVDGKNERWSLTLSSVDELNDEITRAKAAENSKLPLTGGVLDGPLWVEHVTDFDNGKQRSETLGVQIDSLQFYMQIENFPGTTTGKLWLHDGAGNFRSVLQAESNGTLRNHNGYPIPYIGGSDSNSFQIFSTEAKHGDWVSFPKAWTNFRKNGRVCNIRVLLSCVGTWGTDYDGHGGNNVLLAQLTTDANGDIDLDRNGFRISLLHYWTEKDAQAQLWTEPTTLTVYAYCEP
ncbi:hypothetical protein [Aristophania vespae]|uniref:hypothetical protein n=1 Tax=Aristophania vespae TaxID=2697033 RepID=UPI002351322F|nr:hypothetical protein [Aristophania vespae]